MKYRLPPITFRPVRRLPSSARRGFTLIEMIIYLSIVSMVLVSLSYLILDIIGGQTKSTASQEVNHNVRFISQQLRNDITSASDIGSITAAELTLTLPGDDVTYAFDAGSKTVTRQVGANPAVVLNTQLIDVVGSFANASFNQRSKNVTVELTASRKNPDNIADYNADTTVRFSVELRGRR